MRAYVIKTNASDKPLLVIADSLSDAEDKMYDYYGPGDYREIKHITVLDYSDDDIIV